MDDNLLWQPLKGAEERRIRLVFDAYKQYTCFLLYKFLQTDLKTFFFNVISVLLIQVYLLSSHTRVVTINSTVCYS